MRRLLLISLLMPMVVIDVRPSYGQQLQKLYTLPPPPEVQQQAPRELRRSPAPTQQTAPEVRQAPRDALPAVEQSSRYAPFEAYVRSIDDAKKADLLRKYSQQRDIAFQRGEIDRGIYYANLVRILRESR